jgi:hypothetical protein
LATRQSTRDIPGTGEIADNDLGAGRSQRISAFIVASHKRANRQAALAERPHNSATHSADAACGASDKNRTVDSRAIMGIASLLFRHCTRFLSHDLLFDTILLLIH